MKTWNAKARRDRAPLVSSSTPRARPSAVSRRRSPTRSAARASRSTRRTSTPATSSSSSTPRRSRVTGKKLDQKMYYRHSGYPGGLRSRHAARAARAPADRGAPQGRQGHAPAQQARARPDQQAQDLRRPEHPHEAQAPTAAGGDARERARAVPRHRQAQDLGRPRDPAPRRRHDVVQRPHDRGLLPARDAPRRSRSRR